MLWWPRGRALGYTAVMPTSDRYSQSRNQLLDQMAYAMGGRTAEEIVFHDPTTGASNDIEKATNIARTMVIEYGFSDKLGAIKWGDDDDQTTVMDGLQPRKYSDPRRTGSPAAGQGNAQREGARGDLRTDQEGSGPSGVAVQRTPPRLR